MIVTTSSGTEKWRKDLAHAMGSEVYLAPDAAGIVASSYSAGDGFRFLTEVLDAEGKDLRSAPMLMRHAAFDPVSGVLAIADRDSAVIFVPEKAERQGCWKSAGEGECILGIATVSRQAAIMTAIITADASGVTVQRPAVVITGMTGEELMRVPVTGLSGRGLTVRTESGVFVAHDELELITIPITQVK